LILEIKNIKVEHNMEKTLIILKPSIPESEKQISITKEDFQKKFFEIIKSK